MTRSLPSLGDSLEWNLVGRGDYVAQVAPDGLSLLPIPSRDFLIENGSHVVAIGVDCTKKLPSWYTGGFASQNLLFSVGSTTEFPAVAIAANQRVQLGRMNLLIFEKLLAPWLLRLEFPRWFRDVSWEVWRYDGPDTDQTASTQVITTTTAASSVSKLLLPARANRKGAVVINNSTAPLYLELGAVATTDSVLVLYRGGYYEVPYGYSEAISGVWDAAVGTATIKEFL